jgi:hypothetical protein
MPTRKNQQNLKLHNNARKRVMTPEHRHRQDRNGQGFSPEAFG